MRNKILGVIFDLDGTIIDTLELRVTAWQEAFKIYGITIERDVLKPLIGLPGEDLAGKYSANPRSIEDEEERNFLKFLSTIKTFPDVDETFDKLASSGIKLVIVTSSRRALVEKLMIPKVPVVTIDDVKKGKPHTEPYETAIRIMNVPCESVLVVGDSENDMIPGKKLGCRTALIRHGKKIISESAEYYIDEVSEVPVLIESIQMMQ
ncbi:MAG: HAD family phosphatase [Candidatus Thermoplasmatota archaeon]|nr:HAD family phosphatase [Candidatus Thermoplasmatota archaeon]MCL5730859.1 HAD family phosphatase [Candidatus Thermoplasmatota archaeon]